MRVWYVRYEDDENLIDPDETIFFSTEEAALAQLQNIETSRRIAYEASQRLQKERWETTEMAVDALEAIGIDWRITLPYHKRTWNPKPYISHWSIASIEVQQ